jgi:hypothetical protein
VKTTTDQPLPGLDFGVFVDVVDEKCVRGAMLSDRDVFVSM